MAKENQRLTFISYSRRDAEFALELAKELKASGFSIWLDQLDIPTGSRWDDEIQTALEKCEIFMVILTGDSITSNNVKDEIGYAIDSNKRILPVLLERANIPFRLRRFQYVDFTNKSHNEGISFAKQLLQRLIDEPVELPAISPDAQNQQSQADRERSAEIKANMDRLARQRAEAIRNARERDEMGRRSQVVHPSPVIERRPPQTQRQPMPKTMPIFAGLALVLLLCLGGGWAAWPFIFPPTPTRAASIPTTAVPTTETPTITFTPLPTMTPSPAAPDPVQFVVDYWNYVSKGQYDSAWKLLSQDFRQRFHKNEFDDYKTGYESKNYCRIETSNGHLLTQEGNLAVVSVEVTYYMGQNCGPFPYDFTITLIYNEVEKIWQYDKSSTVKK